MKETDLYFPLKRQFENLGYNIQAEVLHLDFMACKDQVCLGIELKLELNTKVIAQAIKRREVMDIVYIATLKPETKRSTTLDKHTIMKALGIGLIYVDVINQTSHIVFDANQVVRTKPKKKRALKNEFNQRLLSTNEAGTNQAVMTAYKEQTLVILHALREGLQTIKDIKKAYAIKGIQDKLYKNYYLWFTHLRRGEYCLSELGLKAYETFQKEIEIVSTHYKKR